MIRADSPTPAPFSPNPAFTLRQLECFHAAASLGTFAAAATQLRLTATAVSASVRDLERTLNTELLVRKTAHGVSLTASGRALLPHAADLLHAASELQSRFGEPGAELSGPVALGVEMSLAAHLLPNLLDAVAHRHPHLTLSFSDNTMQLLGEEVLSGHHDFGVGFASAVPAGCATTPLAHASPHAVLAADHPLARASTVSLSDLAQLPLVALDQAPTAAHTLALFAQSGHSPGVVTTTFNHELAWALVAREQGFTIIANPLPLRTADKAPQVVAVPIIDQHIQDQIVAFWPAARRLGFRAVAVVNLLREELQARP